jgi:hypothetical protein
VFWKKLYAAQGGRTFVRHKDTFMCVGYGFWVVNSVRTLFTFRNLCTFVLGEKHITEKKRREYEC